MPRTITWTPTMDATLRDMRAAGHGYNPIGERLGVSGGIVAKRVTKLELPKFTRGRFTRPLALPTGQDVLVDRLAFPAGHPVTWGAISSTPWGTD